MNPFTHTPEPWEYRENGSDNGFDGYFAVPGQPREFGLIDHDHPANSARIVACVNGCKGIADPETTVPELVRTLQRLLAKPGSDTYYEGVNADAEEEARALLAKINS